MARISYESQALYISLLSYAANAVMNSLVLPRSLNDKTLRAREISSSPKLKDWLWILHSYELKGPHDC